MLPDYLHSAEADHFAFIRVPKILLQNEAFQGISVEAKLLYSLLFDRTELSNKNGWKDDQDRVYIIFTVAEIQENLNCGNKKAIQLLDELENKAGLIERKRQGLGKPNLIYVKSFYRAVDNSGERHFLKCQNDTSGSVKTASLEVSESHSIRLIIKRLILMILILLSFREANRSESTITSVTKSISWMNWRFPS